MNNKLAAGLFAMSCGLGISAPLQANVQDEGFRAGNTTISMKGYIKLDTIAVRTSDGDLIAKSLRDFYVPSTTPIGGGSSSKSLTMQARESRFAFHTKTDVGTDTPLTGVLEMDFGPAREVWGFRNGFWPRQRSAKWHRYY